MKLPLLVVQVPPHRQGYPLPRLFILDQSMLGVGGHNFHQVALIAEAALRRGYEPIVAANRRVVRRDWPVPCALVPQFPDTSYNGCSVTVRSDRRPPLNPFRDKDRVASDVAAERAVGRPPEKSGPAPSLARRVKRAFGDRWIRYRSRKLALRLAKSMAQFFERFPLTPDDFVLLPTVTEFDLVGIVEFLAKNPEAQRARWRIVFHYPLVTGPWTGNEEQLARQEVMRSHFQELIDRVPKVNWQLYGTNPLLVEQYQRLGVASVECAHAPVQVERPAASSTASRDRGAPLRVLCAGGLRPSKQSRLLRQLIDDLERDNFAGGRLQLWVQADSKRRLVRRSGGRNWVTIDPLGSPPDKNIRLVHVPYPVPAAAYAHLLRSADIGLLGYSAISYAAMQSGVLAEFLATGIPVVVTDQTWMARELAMVAGGGNEASGLVASTPAEFGDALRTIADDIELYRARASRIAPVFAAQNSADALLEIITRPR